MSKTTRLGRGLEAIIPKNYLNSGRSIMNIPLEKIVMNPYQPRRHFDKNTIEELSKSIDKIGVLQPILVRKLKDGYELVAGERRFRASKLAGKAIVPAIVKDLSDEESLKYALIENIDREDLNPIDTAEGYQRLINEFNFTHESLSAIFHRTRSSITNTLRLLGLPKTIKEALIEKQITEGHARAILGLSSVEDQGDLCKEIQKKS